MYFFFSVKNKYQIDDLACTGSENCIFECSPAGWKVEKSNATEWLGVTCKQKLDCQWGEWSSYSDCSVTCGTGNQIRTREKTVEEQYGGLCQDSAHDSKICTLDPCCPGKILDYSFLKPSLDIFLSLPGLYMIGYGTGKIILKFPPFCQLNEECQERDNSK